VITDAVIDNALLTASLPAAVVLDTGTWRPWVSGEILGGLLHSISDTGTGTIYEPYDIIPDIPESVMLFEYEFTPDDIGSYPFTATPDMVSEGDVVSSDLELIGTGLWEDRIIQVSPDTLDFEQIGSVPDITKVIAISVRNRKALLTYDEGTVSDPAFEVVPLSVERVLQPAVTPDAGKQYYLHTDGSITTNPTGALAPVAYGYAGKWRVGSAP